MIGKTVSHYPDSFGIPLRRDKILEKLGEARLLMTCIREILEILNG